MITCDCLSVVCHLPVYLLTACVSAISYSEKYTLHKIQKNTLVAKIKDLLCWCSVIISSHIVIQVNTLYHFPLLPYCYPLLPYC